MEKTDIQLQQDVEAELHWDPKVNAAHIGVVVDQGTVSLLGVVDTYAQRGAAEQAARRVSGVRIVAQELSVKLTGAHVHTDSELAAAIRTVLGWSATVPDTVTVSVRHGFVTLHGEVAWHFQREAAARAVGELVGVVGIDNRIALLPTIARRGSLPV